MIKLKIFLIGLLMTGAANMAAQEEGSGQGSVNISQDQRLQNIVSGETPVVERKPEAGTSDTKEPVKKNSPSNSNRTSAPRRIQRTQIVDVKDLPTFGNRSNNDFDVRTGARRRLRGFRIQMFWGNSLRTDQLRAKRLGDKVTGAFPELKAYVSFQQPHWRCRVGDFKTRAGAARYLDKMRKIAPEAMIVRSEIIIYQ
jgi:hypothetical protein